MSFPCGKNGQIRRSIFATLWATFNLTKYLNLVIIYLIYFFILNYYR